MSVQSPQGVYPSPYFQPQGGYPQPATPQQAYAQQPAAPTYPDFNTMAQTGVNAYPMPPVNTATAYHQPAFPQQGAMGQPTVDQFQFQPQPQPSAGFPQQSVPQGQQTPAGTFDPAAAQGIPGASGTQQAYPAGMPLGPQGFDTSQSMTAPPGFSMPDAPQSEGGGISKTAATFGGIALAAAGWLLGHFVTGGKKADAPAHEGDHGHLHTESKFDTLVAQQVKGENKPTLYQLKDQQYALAKIDSKGHGTYSLVKLADLEAVTTPDGQEAPKSASETLKLVVSDNYKTKQGTPLVEVKTGDTTLLLDPYSRTLHTPEKVVKIEKPQAPAAPAS